MEHDLSREAFGAFKADTKQSVVILFRKMAQRYNQNIRNDLDVVGIYLYIRQNGKSKLK